MNLTRIFGLATLVVGALLLGFAYNATDAPVEQISNTLTGRYTDATMNYGIAGVVAVVVGGCIALFGRRRGIS